MRPDHLGDVLLSRPAVELIRRTLPDAELTVLAGPGGVASLQGIDARIATFPFPGFTRMPKRSPLAPYLALAALAGRLRRERFDAALVLRPDHWWGALAAALVGIPIRVGHAIPEVAPFLTDSVRATSREASSAAALRAAQALVRTLGKTPVDEDRAPRFSPSEPARRAARTWLDELLSESGARGNDRSVVAIHPGAGAGVKCWPASRWARVIQAIAADAQVVLTGSADEARLVPEIQSRVDRPVRAELDRSWEQLAALYEVVDLVVGMDSGPLHLATAVGTPTLRVYGPTDPAIYGPAGSPANHRVIQAALPCQPCGNLIGPPCGYLQDPPCLAAVSVDHVVEAIRSQVCLRATTRAAR
jgi:heptosyltransferase-2/heptosyltransferase-3